MKASEHAISLIKSFEGLVPVAAPCPAGVLTVGYGSTLNVKPGDVISEEDASARLGQELAEYETAVTIATHNGCGQHQFDALVSFAYNVGCAGMRGSTVIKCHNRGDYEAAARAFSLWNKGGGRVLPGLVRRRAAEAALYLTPDDGELPMAQKVDPEKPLTESNINRGSVIAGGTAGVAAATQVLDSVTSLKYSMSSLGEWLVPILLVVTIAAVGYVIWSRFKMRDQGIA